ncbi:MAG TPA: TolC family protein [Steroidobacteraceae bacterium]
MLRKMRLALALAALSGCAGYSPHPLPAGPNLEAQATATDEVRPHPPLDMNAVATLAVLNNPDIRAARAQTRVADTQAFAAGILPEPQFSGNTDVPYDRVTSPRDPRYPEYHAYGFALAIDVRALLTHASKRTAADAAYRQAREEMLWKEWQTVAEARTLYVAQSIAGERRALLTPAADEYALAAARSQRALARHDVTLDQSGADVAALAVVRAQQGAADRDALNAAHALHALLGLSPDAVLSLEPLGPPQIPDRADVAAAGERLPTSRPDLRALREGYRSEEAQVRIAVLSQFPNVVVGITRARDVSDVHTNGGTISLNLPIFDGSRGDIAIQNATREQLRAEYQARLDQATADIWKLWDEIQELRSELDDLDNRLRTLQDDAGNSHRAFVAGNFPAASYFISVNALITAQSNRLDLLQNLWRDSIALATVTGTQVQPAP